jgi:hypothetical protein
MKKSKIITLGLLASTALACDDPSTEVRHCVDNDGVVVDEAQCSPLDGGENTLDDAGVPIIVPHASTPHIYYRWYYGGYREPLIPGTRIIITNGGSFRPSVGHIYSSPSTFSRGGFGETGHSFGGGGGAGE